MTASSVEPTEIDRVAGALRQMGADSAVLTSSEIAHLVAIGRNLVSLREIPGVSHSPSIWRKPFTRQKNTMWPSS